MCNYYYYGLILSTMKLVKWPYTDNWVTVNNKQAHAWLSIEFINSHDFSD